MKLENLQRHVANQHPKAQIPAAQLLSTSERRRLESAKAAAPRPSMTPRGKQIVAIAAVVMAVLLALVLIPRGNVGPLTGQAAPDFTLPTSDGGSITLSALRGRPVLLEFMDIDCPHCINEAPILSALYGSYSARVAFVSVDTEIVPPSNTPAQINQFRTTYATPWQYALFDANVVSAYQIQGTPTTFIIDRNGVVARTFVGETSAATLKGALDDVLK